MQKKIFFINIAKNIKYNIIDRENIHSREDRVFDYIIKDGS